MTGPDTDAEVAGWVAALGLPHLVDLHLHFLPDRMQQKVWAYFDEAAEHYGTPWPIEYRVSEADRVEALRKLNVGVFAPLVYAHKPGMGAWLTDWVLDFAARTPGAVPTATIYPEPGVTAYLGAALAAGARCVKAHVQVGRYDPRDPMLDEAWGMIADAGVPVVVHCGHGPGRGGEFTGLDVFEEVLRKHPKLTAVLAHAGMPEIGEALALAQRYPRVHLDTTMVGVPFTATMSPLPPDWLDRLADLPDRIVLGTDFPSIPYPYADQLKAIAGWAEADDRLGEPFLRAVVHDNPLRLLRPGTSG